MKDEKVFVLYDGRARFGDEDSASIIVVEGCEESARREGETTWKGHDAVWYEYDLCEGELINPHIRYDLPPKFPE